MTAVSMVMDTERGGAVVSLAVIKSDACNVSPNSDDVQVIFVDLQPELVVGSKTVSPQNLETAATALAKAATLLNWPMLFCLAPQSGQPAALLPALNEFAHEDNTVSRTIINPFGTPAVASAVEANRRNTFVVAGFTAETAIVQTALAALEIGMNVFVPIDVVGSRSSERTESAALRVIEQAGAVITSVRSFIQRHIIDASIMPGPKMAEALSDV